MDYSSPRLVAGNELHIFIPSPGEHYNVHHFPETVLRILLNDYYWKINS